MGRAIETDNRLDNVERRLKLVEDALEEMVQTRVHHVDLHSDTDKEYIDKLKEEEFTPPAGTRKRTTKRKTAVIEKDSAEA